MHGRSTATLLIAALLSPTATLVAQRMVDGWRSTTTTTVDSGDGRVHTRTSRRIVADGMVRDQFNSNDRASATRGGFHVTNAHDSTTMTVLPSEKMATVMTSTLFGDAPIELPVFVSHTTKSSRVDLGPGEKILGHETHRYRVTTHGSYDATMYGQTCTREVNGTSEIWVATDINLWPMLEMEMRAFGPRMAARVDSLKKVSRARTDASDNSFPLRTRRTETFTDSTGHTHTVVTTMEYTEFEHGPVDRSLFEVPAGYRVRDLRLSPGIKRERVVAQTRPRANPLCRKAP